MAYYREGVDESRAIKGLPDGIITWTCVKGGTTSHCYIIAPTAYEAWNRAAVILLCEPHQIIALINNVVPHKNERKIVPNSVSIKTGISKKKKKKKARKRIK